MSEVVVRPTVSTDLDVLADVLVQVHALDGYPVEGVEEPRAWVELPDSLGQWTALLDGRPVGHVALLTPGGGDGAPRLLAEDLGVSVEQIGVLARLFVSPSARGKSVATRLIDAVAMSAHQMCLYLTLDVMQKDTAAIRLYESLGWTHLGEFAHGLDVGSEPAVAMKAPQYRLGSSRTAPSEILSDGGS